MVYSVFNTNNNTIYIYRYTRNNLTIKKQKRQNKQRKSKEELKQSTKSCKIYCGVEHSRARCFKKVRENFQTRLNIFCVWGSNIFCI